MHVKSIASVIQIKWTFYGEKKTMTCLETARSKVKRACERKKLFKRCDKNAQFRLIWRDEFHWLFMAHILRQMTSCKRECKEHGIHACEFGSSRDNIAQYFRFEYSQKSFRLPIRERKSERNGMKININFGLFYFWIYFLLLLLWWSKVVNERDTLLSHDHVENKMNNKVKHN